MLAFDQFRLDAVNQCLWRGDARIALKPKPFAVLEYLIAHAGRLVTQEQPPRGGPAGHPRSIRSPATVHSGNTQSAG